MKRLLWILLFVCMGASLSFATVPVETSREDYSCNGSTTNYIYPFMVYEDDDLVIVKNGGGTDTPLVLDIDYTVNGAGDSGGGSIDLDSGAECETGYTLTMVRDVDAIQSTDYVDGQLFSAESMESALDRLTVLHQELSERNDRSLHMPIGDSSTTEITDAITRAGTLLGFDNDGAIVYTTSSTADYTGEIVENYATLQAISISGLANKTPAFVQFRAAVGDGGGGDFYWNSSNLSTECTADTQQGIYVRSSDDTTCASGAWVRPYIDEVNIQWFGAAPSASNSVNRTAVQAAIDTKLPILVPGNYTIDDELVLYHGSVLRGLNPKLDKRAISKQAAISSITQATADKSIFTVDQSDLLYTYAWGIKISDIALIGDKSAGAAGLYLKSVAQSEFTNISIYDFGYGIRISYGMLNTFNECVIVGDSTLPACVYIDELGLTTTQTFNACYFRGSQWAYINKSATNFYTISTIFNDCAMETTSVGGMFIGKSCSAELNNMYAENVPADTLIVDGSMFKLGTAGWDGVRTNAFLTINGGHMGGGNGFLWTDSTIFEIGSYWKVSVNAPYIANATQLLRSGTVSFPVGGMVLTDVETVSLSDTTSIDTQVNASKYITGSYKRNGTGNVTHKFTEMERKGINAYVTDYVKITGSGTKISIPITSQAILNVKHSIRLRGIDGTNNVANPKPFYTDFAVGSLTTLTSLTSWNTSANITGVAVNGMTIEITLNYTVVNPQLGIEILSENAELFDFSSIAVL